MSRAVEVRVDGRGRIIADFIGFPEGECGPEAEGLERALRSLGVAVRLQARRLKPPARIRQELDLEPEEAQRPGLAPGSGPAVPPGWGRRGGG